jgi:diacylglycerol kinase family enzyme
VSEHAARLLQYGWRLAEPPQRPVLFVNPASGGGKAARAGLADRARERGISVTVLRRDLALESLVGEAVEGGADALGIAGGDGSLAIVAAAARAHGLPFVCVPAGTRNHFALDLGLDRHDLVGALDALIDGVERVIDVGSVNGRLFLNNVSLGIYGEAVRQPTYRDAKARTLLETARRVLGPSQATPDLRLLDDEGREHRNPAVVLVSNNPYALDRPVAPGSRPRLDSGRLGVVVIDGPGTGPSPGRAWTATSVAVHGPAPVHAGIDGEALDLSTPLVVEILPAALRVRISARHPGVSPSGRLP